MSKTLSVSDIFSQKNALSISDLFECQDLICTYWGKLNMQDEESSLIDERIQNGGVPEYDDKGKEIDWHSIDLGFYENWINELPKIAKEKLGFIIPFFEKYGINIDCFELDQPKYYNYRGDSLDIIFEINEKKDKRKVLKKEISHHVKNLRRKSRDGWDSPDPYSYDKVEMDDHAYIWAICKREKLLEKVKDGLEEIYEKMKNDFPLFLLDALYKEAEKY